MDRRDAPPDARLRFRRTLVRVMAVQVVALAQALLDDQATVEQMRRAFEERANHMHERLTAMPGVTCVKPTGAFYCFPNVMGAYEALGVTGSVEFAEKLLEDVHVAVVPGMAFGNDAHVRLSFATSMEQIDEALTRLERFLQ